MAGVPGIVSNMFGHYVTYVANGYGTSDNNYIEVTFHTERYNIPELKLGPHQIDASVNGVKQLAGSVSTSVENRKDEHTARVQRGSVHEVIREGKLGGGWQFMTIKTDDGVTRVHNYPITKDRSYIVTQRGDVVPQRHGSSVWVDDITGKNHNPAIRGKL